MVKTLIMKYVKNLNGLTMHFYLCRNPNLSINKTKEYQDSNIIRVQKNKDQLPFRN